MNWSLWFDDIEQKKMNDDDNNDNTRILWLCHKVLSFSPSMTSTYFIGSVGMGTDSSIDHGEPPSISLFTDAAKYSYAALCSLALKQLYVEDAPHQHFAEGLICSVRQHLGKYVYGNRNVAFFGNGKYLWLVSLTKEASVSYLHFYFHLDQIFPSTRMKSCLLCSGEKGFRTRTFMWI